MAKIKLGTRPKNFKRTISVPMLDGTTGTIECIFKYRTRKEFGEFIDAKTEAARQAIAAETSKVIQADDAPPQETKPFSLKEYHEKSIDASAEYILDVVESWNLDVELGRASVEELANEYPGAANAIAETYRLAITEGRLGN